MLVWVTGPTVKLVAPPAVGAVTPPDLVKPGSVSHVPEAYVLLSTKYASWAVAQSRASAATRALKPRDRYAENCGIAIAARMPMIATTTSNSINVKPLDRLRPAFCECMNPPLSGARWAAPVSPLCARAVPAESPGFSGPTRGDLRGILPHVRRSSRAHARFAAHFSPSPA